MARPKKPKPKTEIELGILQENYLKDPKKYQNEYMLLLKSYARSLALKEIKGKIVLPPDKIEEIAIVATLKLLAQYKKPGWRVWSSFGGTLRWKVIEALYGDSKEESHLSLNSLIGDFKNKELSDLQISLGFNPLFGLVGVSPEDIISTDYDNLLNELKAIFEEASEILSYHYMLIFKAYFVLLIRRPKIKNAIQNFKKTFINDSKMENVFDTLLLEIRNRLLIKD